MEQLASLFSDPRVVKNRRITSTQFPGVKEWRPIDIFSNRRKRDRLGSARFPWKRSWSSRRLHLVGPSGAGGCTGDACARRTGRKNADTDDIWFRRGVMFPVKSRPIRTRFFNCYQIALTNFGRVFRAQSFVISAGFLIKRFGRLRIDELVDYSDCARGIEHMHSTGLIMRRDFDGGMRATRCRAPNQKWEAKVFAFHFLRDVDHFIKRGRN